jgi:signal transduction histidine kinase
MSRFLYLFLLLVTYQCFGQDATLETTLKKATHDSIRCRILNKYINQIDDNAIKLRYNQQLEKLVQKNLNQGFISSSEKAKFLFYKAETLLNYADYYQSLSPPNDSITLEYNKKCLAVQLQRNNKEGIAESYLNIGSMHYYLYQYPDAITNNLKALKLFRELNNKKSEARCLNNIGLVYEAQGNNPEALKYHYSSLRVKEQLKDKKGIANSFSNIGAIFWQQEKLDEAIKKYNSALNYFKEVKDTIGMADVYTNIGIIYIDQKNYQSAIESHNKALQVYEKKKYLSGMGTAYGNLASAHLYQGNAKKAKEIYIKALDIREKLGNKKGMAYSYLGLGMSELALQNPMASKKYLQQSLTISTELGMRTLIKSNYNNLAKADSALVNYKDAFEHYKKFIAYRDSLSNEETEKKSLQTVMQYEYEKKEAVLKEQTAAEKQEQRMIFVSIISFLCAVLFFSLLWFSFYKKKKVLEKEIEQKAISLEIAEKERRRISADLHDELGSGVSTIALLSNRINQQKSIVDVKEDASNIIENTKKVSQKLTEVIWELNSEHNNLEDLLLFIQKQGNDLFKETTTHFSMLIPIEIQDIYFSSYERKQIYLSVKECFHNIIKHAKASKVSCKTIINEVLIITINDNGIGFNVNEKINTSTGEGLNNLKYRVTNLNGKVIINSNQEGTVITLEIPLNKN